MMRKFKTINGNLIVKRGKKNCNSNLCQKIGILNLSWLLSNVFFENLLKLNTLKITNIQMIQMVYWEMMSTSCHTIEVKKLKLPHLSNRFQSTFFLGKISPKSLDSKSKIKK
jgi:hypothetical protein